MLPPLLVWLHHQPGALQANLALYDRMLAWRTPTASTQLLVIAIDARSLREIGPWPWPRRVHAELLERLALHQPRSVLLDLFFDSPSADDALLAEAMTALPVHLPQRFEDFDPQRPAMAPAHLVPPAPLLAAQARGLGHASVTTDGDDIVRWLRTREGPAAQGQPYVGLAVAGTRSPGEVFGFALAGPAGSYRTVPYVSVLRGEVPPELLRGRDLLVGAVQDAAIGDNVPVSLGGRTVLLPGVELHANAISALREQRAVMLPSSGLLAAWITLPVWLALLLFLRLARHAALVAGLLGLLGFCLSALALAFMHRWLPPFMPLVGIGLAYVLWSWRRLHALMGMLSRRIDSLNAVPAGAFELPLPAQAERRALDVVDQQTDALDRAVHRLAHLQAMLAEGLWRMPAAVLLCREDGRILQSNAQARRLLSSAGASAPSPNALRADDDPLAQADLLHLLAALSGMPIDDPEPAAAVPSAAWREAASREYTTAQGWVLRMQSVPIQSAAPMAWRHDPALQPLAQAGHGVRIVLLHDLTVERQAEHERTRWLGFLSHDLRSPQVTILNLLTLHAERGAVRGQPPPLAAIRREAERTLCLTEGFVDLIEAESRDYRLADLVPAAIVLDAVEQATPLAQLKGIRLQMADGPATDELACVHTLLRVDGSLLQRALYNLLSNALRHSPAGGRVRVCVASQALAGQAHAAEVVIAITDEGEGMTPQRLAELLGSQRGGGGHEADAGSPARRRGIGFAVAQAVVRRHGGWLDAHSAPGQGSTFLLGLPAIQIHEAALPE